MTVAAALCSLTCPGPGWWWGALPGSPSLHPHQHPPAQPFIPALWRPTLTLGQAGTIQYSPPTLGMVSGTERETRRLAPGLEEDTQPHPTPEGLSPSWPKQGMGGTPKINSAQKGGSLVCLEGP